MGFLSFVYRQLTFKIPQLPPHLNLKDKTILITGSNSGIGLEAARYCVELEAKLLILAVRTVSKGESAKADILKSIPSSETRIEVWELEMESVESVLAFGKRAQALPRLDVAMLNAAVFKYDWTLAPITGLESSVQVNHVSTALLSLLLMPILRKSAESNHKPSRLTFTSSEVHMFTPFKEKKAPNILVRLNEKEHFTDPMDRYSVTKLLNVFWVLELVTKAQDERVIINLINPGSVDTGLHRDGDRVIQMFDRVIGRTPPEGARLLLDAALVKGKESHGKYLSEAKLIPVSSYVRSAEGIAMQKKLWDETKEILQKYTQADQGGDLL